MASKKQLQELIKLLKTKTGKKQWELSLAAGYEKGTLTQLISKGLYDEPYNQLKLAFKDTLNNSTENAPAVQLNLGAISQDLSYIIDQQAAIIAEVRGYGQYLVMNANDFDDLRYEKAKALVDKIYASNLAENVKLGKRRPYGKRGKDHA